MPSIKFDIIYDNSLLKYGIQNNFNKENSIKFIVNDFEEKKWRMNRFITFLFDNLKFTALSKKEREDLIDGSLSTLSAAVSNLRKINLQSDEVGKGGEIAEILLYGIMQTNFGALVAVPKIFYKQSTNKYANGADSVHIVIDNADNFTLWLGEAKFFQELSSNNKKNLAESIKNTISKAAIKKENSIITNLNEIQQELAGNQVVLHKIKNKLSDSISIDEIRPILNIPIMILIECPITSHEIQITEDYKSKIINSNKAKIDSLVKKIENECKDVDKFEDITLHFMFFPVPSKKSVIDNFWKKAEAVSEDG